MKSKRELNGYTVIYKPSHPTAMRNRVWDGYVYEHIFVVETKLERSLTPEEVVHHLDGDRSNNYHANLLVLTIEAHLRLHNWINAGAPGLETLRENRDDCWDTYCWSPGYERRFCSVCDATLQNSKLASTCSRECYESSVRSKSKKPESAELATAFKEARSILALGRRYGVSDNTVRKWLKSYGIDPKSISRRA